MAQVRGDGAWTRMISSEEFRGQILDLFEGIVTVSVDFSWRMWEKEEDRGGRRDKLGAWDWRKDTTLYKVDNGQGPTVYTWKSTQYSVMTYMGKESEKEWIYVYV